jgi:pantetheine-phosphate adenylyltransferase
LTIAVYPGSFDPIHYGHVDIAKRAAKLFDKLYWAVYDTPMMKNVLFTTEERHALMNEAAKDTANIEVISYKELTVELCKRLGASVLVRGLRVTYDFEIEYQTALTNRQLAEDMGFAEKLDTICLMTSLKYAFVSSSIVKEVASGGGPTSHMVPIFVEAALKKKMAQLGDARSEKIKLVSLPE